MMSTDYHPCPVCGLEEAHALMENAVLSAISCPRCGAGGTFDPGDDVPMFDPDDYDWIDDQCPEESGLVLVDRGGGAYGVECYIADEDGDCWVQVCSDGSAGTDLPKPYAWAELPAGCHDFPRPYTPKHKVYNWGGVWAWVISYNVSRTPKDEVCWPFRTKAEATADLKAKLAEIKETAE
jgi:hypothetical protein